MPSYSSFGITDVDDMLGGGLLPGGSYLLEIESGTEELAFIASYLEGGWRQKELSAIITYDLPHQELMKRLAQLVDVQEKMESGDFRIVDLWTEARTNQEPSPPVFMTSNPRDFNIMRRISYELAAQIPKMIKDQKFSGIRIATCSLSSMIMNYKFERAYEWAEAGLDLARKSSVTSTLAILNPKMFDETQVAALEHVHDGAIVLTMKELGDKFQRYIRVKKSPITGFSTRVVPYDIVDKRPHLQKE